MSETVNRAESDLRLRESIDALATRLVVDGVSHSLSADLAHLREMAGESGCAEAARIAAQMAERTCAGDETAAIEEALRDGLAQLAQTLEKESPPGCLAHGGTGAERGAPSLNPLAQDPELVSDFILESREHLASIETGMLILEQNPGDVDAIHSVFRCFHTIKGLAGFLEFGNIHEVAHEVETLLDLTRNSKLAITPFVVDIVLASADYLKQAIAGVEATLAGAAPQPVGDHSGLLSRIRASMNSGPVEAATVEFTPSSVPEAPNSRQFAQGSADC